MLNAESQYNAPMSRSVVVAAALLVGAAAIGIAQAPGGRQGRGDRQPDAPLPNIREYKPTSTLVVPQHSVPRAKFPVIDMHGHPPPLTTPEAVDKVVAAMDPLNLRIMAVTGNPGRISREQMRQDLQVVGASKHKDRFAIFANIDFRNVGPGFGQMAAEQLEADVKAGAVGLGEIMKDFGLTAPQGRWQPAEAGRPRARSDLDHGRPSEHSGHDARRRSGAVLGYVRLLRTSATSRWRSLRIVAVRRSAARPSRS